MNPRPVRAIRLREATLRDAALLRAWRNDPTTRAASRQSDVVTPTEHISWLERVLADSDRLLFVAEDDGVPIGQARLERRGGRWEISVSLSADMRGRGGGSALIDAAVERLSIERGAGIVEAWIRENNGRSLAVFRTAGFAEEPGRGGQGFVVLTRTV